MIPRGLIRDLAKDAKAAQSAILHRRKAAMDALTERALVAMPGAIASDFQRAMTAGCRGKGFADYGARRPAGRAILAGSVLRACQACEETGMVLSTFDQLTGVDALDAIVARFDSGRWKGPTVGIVMGNLRTVARCLFGFTPPVLKARASHWTATKKKKARRQLSSAEYLQGALDIAAIADFAEAAGQGDRAQALRIDAALLAAASDLNGRLGEYEASDLSVVNGVHDGKPTLKFYWDGKLRKNKKTRVAAVSNPQAVGLLRMVIARRRSGPVFCNLDGRGMTSLQIYDAMRRATFLAVGFRASPNSLRDAGAARSTNPVTMAAAVGSSPHVALMHYRGSMSEHGRELIARALDSASGE